jgi:hypothetical protein
MKKLLLIAMILGSFSTQAATVGTLNLIGIIPKKVEITVTPKPAASTLDLTTTATNLSVATVTGKSNVLLGYKITIASANLGKLINSGSATPLLNEVAYTMKLDAATVALTAPTVLNFTGLAPFTKDVTVSYTGVAAEDYKEGNYTDTVTFTIAAN